ncbi:MAG: hypothetical protein PHX74_01890 [Candidatus Sumerlaeales bacterium]|nr:hypothetical protein [Candidatus Sumerlaeales bacterium]
MTVDTADLARITFVQGKIAAATIEMQGMVAENNQRLALGQSASYTDKDFMSLIDEYGLGHNALLTEIYGHQ